MNYSPYSSNHRVTIREGNEIAVIFASDVSLAKLKEAETIHFDATLKAVTSLFDLPLTILRIKEHAIPAIYIRYIHLNRRMPDCITMVQTANDLCKPEIQLNWPKNDTFRPIIRLKKLQKTFSIDELMVRQRFAFASP